MKNNLTVFEGHNLEILTKEDLNLDFDGTVLFNGNQVATILGYKRPSDCIRDNVKDNQKYKLKNSDTVNDRCRKLNNAGEMFITEKGVMKLIINSDMPMADDFEDKVWEIVSKVQATGKFDSIEENLKQIKDETERNLSLGLYSLQQAQKANPTDLTISILIGQKTSELQLYKQQKQLEGQQVELNKLKEQSQKQGKKIDNMFVVGDRTQFVREVNNVSRATGHQQSEIYGSTYGKLKDLYSIDLETRSKNKKEEIQKKRMDTGKKPYSPETLNNKAGKLVIADEMDIFRELGMALNAVKNELLA